ncbi:MAG: YbbC/YhhH family protein [Acidobacteriota bacterium]
MKTLFCTLSGLFVASVFAGGCSCGLQTTTATNQQRPETPYLSQNSRPSGEESKTGYVSNEQEAVEIAVRSWVPIYGKDQIENEKPYVAELKNEIWTVTGSLPKDWVGGVAIARISQKDGKILETGHTK